MIIYSGFGFLVLIITIGSAVIGHLVTSSLAGSNAYGRTHHWPFALSLLIAAAICWFLGRYLHGKHPLPGTAPLAYRSSSHRRTHSLFFIPMEYWGLMIALLAVYAFGMDLFHW